MASGRKLYVITAPPGIRGIYQSWPQCQAAVVGVKGARYQAVASLAEGEAMLRGESVALGDGVYAFVDGNHLGGVGLVFVKHREGAPPVVKEIATGVDQVFVEAGIPTLASPEKITQALGRLRNILGELGGLYQALRHIAPKTRLTVVHDYEGVGAWLTGRWKTKDELVTEIVAACKRLIANKDLSVSFRHQYSHRSNAAGRNDYIFYNDRADAMATRGAKEYQGRHSAG